MQVQREPSPLPGGTLQACDTSPVVEAAAPLLISVSRRTDIPAFYSDWFMDRLSHGYARVLSPFGGKARFISFSRARVFAFWSKDPSPLVRFLPALDKGGYSYFFLFTLNDYADEGLEPGVPSLTRRIQTFQEISDHAGPGRVTWRFDPLVLSDATDVDTLLSRIKEVGDAVHTLTRRMVVSFLDIDRYPHVRTSLCAAGRGDVREVQASEQRSLAIGLQTLNRRWGLEISLCSRAHKEFPGLLPGSCLGHTLLSREFGHDRTLMQFLSGGGQQCLPGVSGIDGPLSSDPSQHPLKDPGQRPECGCVVSADIGEYNCCMHRCAYCYANGSQARVESRYRRYQEHQQRGLYAESLIPYKEGAQNW
ncbi:MAG: DUF1848 domain-containing protein [Methanomicrobiales archaeon]|nr:DUF1848 domain-containing protein [Methanomicrobiales archaeon]